MMVTLLNISRIVLEKLFNLHDVILIRQIRNMLGELYGHHRFGMTLDKHRHRDRQLFLLARRVKGNLFEDREDAVEG